MGNLGKASCKTYPGIGTDLRFMLVGGVATIDRLSTESVILEPVGLHHS